MTEIVAIVVKIMPQNVLKHLPQVSKLYNIFAIIFATNNTFRQVYDRCCTNIGKNYAKKFYIIGHWCQYYKTFLHNFCH
jgi:hypothetical protein